jgi:hypothetical protein
MVDGFLALGDSFFPFPQHRLRKRVKSRYSVLSAVRTAANADGSCVHYGKSLALTGGNHLVATVGAAPAQLWQAGVSLPPKCPPAAAQAAVKGGVRR